MKQFPLAKCFFPTSWVMDRVRAARVRGVHKRRDDEASNDVGFLYSISDVFFMVGTHFEKVESVLSITT